MKRSAAAALGYKLMKITYTTRKEWTEEYLDETDIKHLIYDLMIGVSRDLTLIQRQIEELHKEIKELKKS